MPAIGVEVLIPSIVVLILAIISRRTIEPLFGGVIVGLFMLDTSRIMTRLTDTMLAAMTNEIVAWVILACGLMGSLIVLLIKIGGADAFGKMVATRIHSRTGALMAAWLLGLTIFIDDYLNSLTISSSMKKVTDSFRVSREMLAYVVDSTAAPVCVLIPVSTWVVFFIALLEESAGVSHEQAVTLYLQAIPYMFYAWSAVIIVPLVIAGKIPLLGAMKTAEKNIRPIEAGPIDADKNDTAGENLKGLRKSFILNFLVPILSLIFFTWYFDIDILKGVIITLGITIVLTFSQGLLGLADIFNTIIDGFKSMLFPLGTVFAGFTFKDVNDQLGLTTYVIDTVGPLMTPLLLPAVTFVTMAAVAFATGSFWGVFAIAMPIIMPLAIATGVDLPLTIGAVISASVFGSHACFFGDSTVLSAHGSGCGVMDHALTQLPYVLLAAAVACIAFVLVAAL